KFPRKERKGNGTLNRYAAIELVDLLCFGQCHIHSSHETSASIRFHLAPGFCRENLRFRRRGAVGSTHTYVPGGGATAAAVRGESPGRFRAFPSFSHAGR